jgi:hypothetical protein
MLNNLDEVGIIFAVVLKNNEENQAYKIGLEN